MNDNNEPRPHWRNGPGIVPLALAVWAILIFAAYFIVRAVEFFFQ